MKFYEMSDKVPLASLDGTERAGLFKRSHRFMQTKTGSVFVDYTHSDEGEPFSGVMVCELDDEDATGVLPTFFMSPALIATRQFYQDLLSIGIDNIEAHPVVIKDEPNNRTIDDYLVLNIIGRISCAVMAQSDCESINESADVEDPCESMTMINDLVIDASKVGCHDLFLVHEDTSLILVSERVYKHLQPRYPDVWFEEVRQL